MYILNLQQVPIDTYVRKKSRDLRTKIPIRILKQSKHPNEGETGRKSSLNESGWHFCTMEDMANMRVDSWCR